MSDPITKWANFPPHLFTTTPMGGESNSTSTDFWTTPDGVPAVPGAYVLAINLPALVEMHIRAKPPASLAPGCYLYCGSAKGPGGLRARLAHHMRHGKSIHWHIDRLTESGTVLGAWTFPGGDECDLVTALSHLPVAIEGFGSTDCRKCTSHLLRWPPGKSGDLSVSGATTLSYYHNFEAKRGELRPWKKHRMSAAR